jgi:hypothetical protein
MAWVCMCTSLLRSHKILAFEEVLLLVLKCCHWRAFILPGFKDSHLKYSQKFLKFACGWKFSM